MISKPNLPAWYAKEAGVRAVTEFETLRGMLDGSILYTSPAGRVTRPYKVDEVRTWVSRAATDKRDAAGVRGTAVHKIAELESQGRASEVDAGVLEKYRPYIDSYRAFVSDYEVRFTGTETTYMNLTHDYAGSGDFSAHTWEHQRLPVIGDWKTSDSGPYWEWALQVVAYMMAEFILVRDGSSIKRAPKPEVNLEEGLIVRLLADRYEVFQFGACADIPVDVLFAAFKSAANLHKVKRWTEQKRLFAKGQSIA